MDNSTKKKFLEIDSYPENYLYCYKSEKTSMYSLANKNLRFSPLGSLNDPIENTLLTSYLDTDTRFTKEEIPEYNHILNNIAKKYCDNFVKTLSFCQSSDPDKSTLLPMSHKGYMKFSMWSQYADVGKGACIILDKTKINQEFNDLLKKENIFGKYGNISYTESFDHNIAFSFNYDEINMLKNDSRKLRYKIERYYKEYFFKKRQDWSNEHEYRYLIISNRIQSLDITDSIAGIVFGYNATNDFINVIEKFDHLKYVPKDKIKLQGYYAYRASEFER